MPAFQAPPAAAGQMRTGVAAADGRHVDVFYRGNGSVIKFRTGGLDPWRIRKMIWLLDDVNP